MRILHAIRSDGFAGVESHVALLSRAQADAGDEVVVIGGDPHRMTTAAGRAVRTLPAATVMDVLFAVRRWAVDADVVHAHMTAAEIACATALLGLKVLLVVTCHFARGRGSNPVSSVAAALASRRVDAQIAISHYVAESIVGPSIVIHPGVDGSQETRPAAERANVVLLVQRLEPEKDSDVALRAFAASGVASQGWRLDIAGDGAERPRLASLAADLGVADATHFLGHRADVPELMRRASVLLAPCRIEGLGLAVLEAMGAALPVVAVGAGGHLETVGAADGAALHAPGDHDGAGRQLAGLVADAQRRDIYAADLQRIQRTCFTPEHQARLTRAVYQGEL